jgi:DNA primase
LRTVTLSFHSGRTAEEVVVDDAAGLAWIVNLGCIELHPHPVRSADLDHPDELRVDLDPGPGVNWSDVRTVALEVKALLDEMGLVGWPKTSGSRGMHVNVRSSRDGPPERFAGLLSRCRVRLSVVYPRWRARNGEEERHGVFLVQNAKDRTTCSAYSVRPLPDARVSTPLHWRGVSDCEPPTFHHTVPKRFGDRRPHADMDAAPGSLEQLLERRTKTSLGVADAPWPPHFRKMEGKAPA